MEGWVIAAIVIVALLIWSSVSEEDERKRVAERRRREEAVEEARRRAKEIAAESRKRQRQEDEVRLKAAVNADLEAEKRARADGSYVTDHRTAEKAMERAMARYLGLKDARCTGAGSDEGIDIVARGAIAQVKHHQNKVPRSDIQRLVGARRNSHQYHDCRLLFFAFGGDPYSRPAVQYGDTAEVALFSYNASGEIFPINAAASKIRIRDEHLAARAHAAWQAREASKGEDPEGSRWRSVPLRR